MTSSAGQPGQLYGSAKTHKFDDISDINVEKIKFRPIISQVGTFTHAAAQVIGNYLKPLVDDNEFMIKNTQDFATIIMEIIMKIIIFTGIPKLQLDTSGMPSLVT